MRADRLKPVELPPEVLAECEQRKRDAIRRMKGYDTMPRHVRSAIQQSVTGRAIAR